MPVLPKHATDVEHFGDATLAKPIGSGPYVVEDVKPGARLLLRRDPNYWGADLPSQRGFYNFDEIDIQYFRDGNSLFEAFKAGLLDYRDETSTTRWATGYDFPALRRRARRQGGAARTTIPKGWRASSSIRGRPLFQRHPPARSARHDVRLRMGQRQSLFGPLHAHQELLRRVRFSLRRDDRRASAERALLAPFPGAVREDILEGRWRPPVNDGTGRDREMAKRALALLAARRLPRRRTAR